MTYPSQKKVETGQKLTEIYWNSPGNPCLFENEVSHSMMSCLTLCAVAGAVARALQRGAAPRGVSSPSQTAHLSPLIPHHSPHTTHLIHLTSFISDRPSHTLLISHHSSRTLHLTPYICHTIHISHTTHLSPLLSHHSSRPLISHYSFGTTHLTLRISHHSSHTTRLTPLIPHHSSQTTHLTPLISHHSSHTTHISPLISYHWKTQNFTCGVIRSFYFWIT